MVEQPRRPNGKADRIKRAYEAGVQARRDGLTSGANPYNISSHRFAWQRGLFGEPLDG